MKKIPVVVFGCGGVGRETLRQIVAGRNVSIERNQISFDIVGIADSQSLLWNPEGLNDARLEEILVSKEAGGQIGGKRPSNLEILDLLDSVRDDQALVVDVTAADGMGSMIDQAINLGFGVALANKKPLSGPWQETRTYFNHPRLRYESTVGGGQPVIATLRYLLDTKDPIFQIEGQLSGTLGYITGRLDEGVLFSQALSEAKEKGFTEPDPREDLGGRDVMRKIMILGRTAGWPLEEKDIEVEMLYHPSLKDLPVADFMNEISMMDRYIQDKVERAGKTRQLLRYVAMVDERGGSVGLEAIPMENPLANLKYISFKTGRYMDEPLMIGGKGAGVEMTAAGVIGDMIALVRETN